MLSHSYNPYQMVHYPRMIDEYIPADDPVRVLDMLVENLNLQRFEKLCKRRGGGQYHPKMMLKVFLYAYMSNIYTCREIESRLRRDLYFMWLARAEKPDFIAINRFYNLMKQELNEVFTQIVLEFSTNGFISLEVEYNDSTKIESKANKYTFVWKKDVEEWDHERMLEKIKALLEQIDDLIVREQSSENNQEVEVTPELLAEMSSELRNALGQKPAASTKEEKATLK